MEKNKDKKEKKERKRRRRKGERRRRGRKIRIPLIYRRSVCRSSSARELKFIYSTRSNFEEVGTLPTLPYFHPKGCLAGIFIGLPYVNPTLCLQFGTSFWLGNRGNLSSCSS